MSVLYSSIEDLFHMTPRPLYRVTPKSTRKGMIVPQGFYIPKDKMDVCFCIRDKERNGKARTFISPPMKIQSGESK
ncbi:hypothetical protein CEXT_44921 [Caerostris extrusa]|uniref:Uncharacterized protein n=1 Tax=Caerostris extrusa TaxID=172846 RepID=A0AAV4TRX0_CAEEX|nr:hypothetical protein CEXT_44921 [Caerostris extrusa]